MRTYAAAVGTAALALCAPALAGASVYCAGTSAADCSGVYAGTGDGLQQAIDAADVNFDIGGTPDTVRIGPGTYKRTSGADFHTAGGDLTVEGSGQSTVLTTDAASNRTVLKVDGGGTSAAVRNLRVDLAGDANGIFDFQRVSDVRVTGPGRAIVAIRLKPGSRLTRAVIDPASVYADGVSGYGPVVVEDVAVLMRRGASSDIAVALSNSDTQATAVSTVRHLTVLGDGQPLTRGVLAQAIGGAPGARTLTVNVRDSVLRNLSTPLIRSGDNADPTKLGTANMTFRYSSLDATKNSSSGPGTITPGPGNLADPDPLFAPDLSLTAGSPLIDAGDPAGPEAGDSSTDAGGNPRVIGTRRDIGAFEFRPSSGTGGPGSPTGPNGTLTTASASALVLSPKAFRAAASGPSVSVARRRAPVGTTVRYTLNMDASVRFSVRQSLRGRRVRKGGKTRCVKPTAKLRKARRCTRVKTRGTFTQAGRAGSNSFRFRGRVRGRKLKPGRYSLVATPAANGVKGKTIRTAFRIVK